MALDPAIELVLRLVLASILLQAAWHKGRDRQRFVNDLAGYRLLPQSLLRPASVVLPCAEVLVALALAARGGAFAIAGAAGLLATYSAAITINLARGRRDVACGCGGPFDRRPIGAALLMRNAGLIALTLACALPPVERPLGVPDLPMLLGGWASLTLLYGAAEIALANHDRQRSWRMPA